jgi:hypothetical protein
MRIAIRAAVLASVLLGWGTVTRGEPSPDGTPGKAGDTAARKEYDALCAEWQKAYQAYRDGFEVVKTQEDLEKAQARYPKPEDWAPRFASVADRYPKDPAAADCIAWIARMATDADVQGRALDRLRDQYFASPAVADACRALSWSKAMNAEDFLRRAIEKHPDRTVQGNAAYGLAKLLMTRAWLAERLARGDGQLKEAFENFYGKPLVKCLVAADPAGMTKEAETLLDRVVEKYADVKSESAWGEATTVGAMARGDLFEIRSLGLGRVAPEIEGADADGTRFKLSDYRGKVVVLEFWSFG